MTQGILIDPAPPAANSQPIVWPELMPTFWVMEIKVGNSGPSDKPKPSTPIHMNNVLIGLSNIRLIKHAKLQLSNKILECTRRVNGMANKRLSVNAPQNAALRTEAVISDAIFLVTT